MMAKWICYACGAAENCDAHCKLETPTSDEPEFCPLTGEENLEWIEDK